MAVSTVCVDRTQVGKPEEISRQKLRKSLTLKECLKGKKLMDEEQ